MNFLLGSEFETSLRILLLLEAASGKALTENEIAALDFITLYSHDFGVTDSNIHGSSRYRLGEFASRRALAKLAIKHLVLDGLISLSKTPEGFQFTLSSDGLNFVYNLDSEYADTYYEIATQILDIEGGNSEQVLNKMINQRAIASLQKG